MRDDQRNFFGFAVAFLVAGILLAATAKADEQVLAESTTGQGGLICDNTDEVETFISKTEAGEVPQEALNAIEGCGILVRPMRMRVTAVKTVKTEKAEYLLVRYDFLDVPSAPQYGIGHRKTAGLGI